MKKIVTESDLNLRQKEIEKAFLDILDGNNAWWEIIGYTGLSKERCIEISKIYNRLHDEYGG